MAIASGGVEQIDHFVKTALANHHGIYGILELFYRAINDLYRLLNYSEEDRLHATLLWCLGGARVADIAHRSLNLPSLRTLHQHSKEIESNVVECFNALLDTISSSSDTVIHQVLMLDEIKVEEWPRWDDHMNFIHGICHEHSNNEKVHFASNAMIGTLTTLDGCKKSKLHMISIASDGESHHGEAFICLTFKCKLHPSSLIFTYLRDLKFMNMEVGNDDLMADKDFKHIFKQCQNLHVNSILNPNDKQDVKLAYNLLHESHHPGFMDTRETLRTLRTFFQHILLPYICIDLDLTEQLIHLSAAAHMLLAMWHEGAGSAFMPSQLYIDIQIMIKNVFFCVVKTKADNPDGQFFLILLGTDHLEELFGILHTMVGGDMSLDILQLVLGILANHPEWDRSPQCLNLPALLKDGLDIHKDVDHIKPASWHGNMSVANVNLWTCWIEGHHHAADLVNYAYAMNSKDGIPKDTFLSSSP
ncbi:hypothetical protein CPB84DRAFT_1816493 [Gymnopilus junonius]|uniref:Uncharacterized protein n=1 Tax=Gymnopilus junonius TaxID=109634 RepID=A0A9P5TLC2_GYMJU|nr:hypothetical protein CPB84DRAFT_1816493 [Gymnopilus junonius]